MFWSVNFVLVRELKVISVEVIDYSDLFSNIMKISFNIF